MKTIGHSLVFLLWLWVSTAAGDEIQWLHSLEEAKQMAKDTQRPILVHFDAAWCGPCKRLDRVVFKDKLLVKAMNENVIALKVNVDEFPELAKQYDVKALPMDVYLSPEGQLTSSGASPKTSAAYQKTIQRLMVDEAEVVKVAEVPKSPKLVFPAIRQPADRR